MGRGCVGRTRRLLAAAVCLGAALVGCTPADDPAPDNEPSPTPSDAAVGPQGSRIAIVIGPPSVVPPAEAASLARAAGSLTEVLDDVAEVRVLEADAAVFVSDLGELALQRGYDLVCVVGTGTAELLAQLARDRRDGSFCGTDPQLTDAPANAVAVGLDAAALTRLGATTLWPAPTPVGLLVGPAVGELALLEGPFAVATTGPSAGASPAGSPTPAPAPSPTAGPSASPSARPSDEAVVALEAGAGAPAALTAAEALVAAGPSRTLLLLTTGGPEAARVVATGGSEVVAVADWVLDAEGGLPPNMLAAITVDWGVVLAAAIEAARAPTPTQVGLLGLEDEVFAVRPGPVEGGEAAAARGNELIEDATAST